MSYLLDANVISEARKPEPAQLMALNKTCRYCPYCDLLIAHKNEIEGYLAAFFSEHRPEIVGHDYLVVGTLDRADWKKGIEAPVAPRDMLERLHDFKTVLHFELVGGWLPEEKTHRAKGRS